MNGKVLFNVGPWCVALIGTGEVRPVAVVRKSDVAADDTVLYTSDDPIVCARVLRAMARHGAAGA